jgi:hypothetical protein
MSENPWQTLLSLKDNWEDQSILYVTHPDGSEGEEPFKILEQTCTGARIRREPVDTLPDEVYDFIAAQECKALQTGLAKWLPPLLERLKPGGAIAASVYAYAGYYGLQMVSTIVRKLTANMDKATAGKTSAAKMTRVARAVVSGLPKDHPAFQRKEFMDRLEQGDKKTFNRLMSISPGTVFTVPLLLETLQIAGARFMGWMLPGQYDPSTYFEDNSIIEKVNALPEPQRWAATELTGAAPKEHHFLVGRAPQHDRA